MQRKTAAASGANASAENWSPEEDEVRIYFERATMPRLLPRATRAPRAVVDHEYNDAEEEDGQEAQIPADLDARVKELCAALAEAERGGHAFIALKWFRDFVSAAQGFSLEPASRVAPGSAGGGHPARRGAHKQRSPTPRRPPIPPPPSASTAPRPASPRRRSASILFAIHGDRSPKPLRGTGEPVSCYFLESTAFAKLFCSGARHGRA